MKDGARFVNTESELHAAFQLRYKIYVEGMGRYADKGDHDRKELKDIQDKDARIIVAAKKSKAVGTLRLFWGGDAAFTEEQEKAYHLATFKSVLDDQQICIIERFMIDDKFRGSMTALRMYQQVMNFVLNQKVEVVLLDCEPHHMESYLKLGFRPFAKEYNYPGIGTVTPMALIVGDYEYLEKVGSPFSSLLTESNLSHCYCSSALQQVVEKELKASMVSQSSKDLIVSNFYKARDQLLAKRTRMFDSRLKMKLSAC